GSTLANYRWWLRQADEPFERASPGLFQQALDDYLRGDWLAAETGFVRLVAANRRDADALLMLATLYRHTRRHDEAHETLRRLERLEAAEKWRLEIETEKQRLAEAAAEDDAASEPEPVADVSRLEVADAP